MKLVPSRTNEKSEKKKKKKTATFNSVPHDLGLIVYKMRAGKLK